MTYHGKEKHKMSQFANPTGFFGKILAKGMAWGHKDFYENTAKALNLRHNDKYLEIGFGSGLFIKKYAAHVARIAGLDHSEDMVNLASSMKHFSSGPNQRHHLRKYLEY